MTTTFADMLMAAINGKNSRLCVGLDPTVDMMPPALMAECIQEHGESLLAAAAAFRRFNRAVIDSVSDIVPVVKPQIAFYEAIGIPGLEVFLDTVNYARAKGLIVIEDAKRNDIHSTAAAYALGHLGRPVIGRTRLAAFDVDAITVNPYLGSDGIVPFLQECERHHKGIFVLVKTSNPSSKELQDLRITGRSVEMSLSESVAMQVEQWGESLIGMCGYSSVGAVVGATYPEQAARLRKVMPHAIFLVPGLGAQGGTAKDVVPCFDERGQGAIVSSSRAVIYAWKNRGIAREHPDADEFRMLIRNAAIQARDEINTALKVMRE